MSLELGASDRRLLAVSGIVVVVLISLIALLSPPAENETGIPSSYSATSGGAKASYLLLKESGYNVERWEQSPTELPENPQGVLLILAEPAVPPRNEETVAINRFLDHGGRVLVTGWNARFIPELDATPDLEALEWKDFRAQLPGTFTRGAPQIRMVPHSHWTARKITHVPLYADDGGVVAVTYRVGRGEVIWWASATPMSNVGISQSHNFEFFLDSIGSRNSVRVLWDEYFHGQQRSLWALAQSTPIPYALAQLGLLAVAVVLTFSRRNGPVRTPREESRLSPLEFLETLGALYRKANAGAVAVEIALARLRFAAIRRFGLPARSTAEDLAQAVADRLGHGDEVFLATLRQAEEAAKDPDLSHAQALDVVRKLHQQAGVLQQKPHRKGDANGQSKPAGGAQPLRAEQGDRRSGAAAR